MVSLIIRSKCVPSFLPRILNSQIKRPFMTGKLSFLAIFANVKKQIHRYRVRECRGQPVPQVEIQ
jgi:hypothetical protein